MRPDIAAALIGAGMLSLLVYPQVALISRAQVQPPANGGAEERRATPGEPLVDIARQPQEKSQERTS
jgi:hypothetical protein